ncbi:unnamed protein product [Diamesa hyperborea]
MFLKITRTIITQKFKESSIGLPRKFSSNSVPLAFTNYENKSSESPPLIIMHGLFGSKSNWNSLCKALVLKANPTRKIISIDARNHGDSPHSSLHSYPAMSDDIARFLSDNQIEKASILGHSMGGRAIMYFALNYPHLVEKAIVVDISPVSPIGTTQTDIPLFLKAMRAIEIPPKHTIHQGRKVCDDKLSVIIKEKSLRDFLITNLAKTENGDFRWRINLESLENNFDEHIAKFPDCTGKQFQGPTLFIGGSKSDYLKPEDKPKIDKLFPNSELVYLNAGHWVHAEQPEEFLKLVLNFVNT